MILRDRVRRWLGIAPAPAPAPQESSANVSLRVLAQFQMNASNAQLAHLGSKVVMPREVRAYQPPPNVVPSLAQQQRDRDSDPLKRPYLAMDSADQAPAYTWLNQQYCGLGFPGYAYLSELSQRSEYRAPSEVIAKEMTRKFIKFNSKGDGDKSDKIAKLEDAIQRYDVRQVLRKALEVDLFFGRSQIFIDIEGQESDEARALPLVISPETIKQGSLRGFKVIEPIWTTPYTYNSIDPTQPDFYVPSAWYILGRRVHATRVITVISRPVPDMLKPAYNFGGISLTQLMEPYVLRWLKTVDGVNRIINNFSVLLLKTNMSAVLQGDMGTSEAAMGLVNRAKLFVATRDNQGLTLLDKDTEEMEQIAVPLSGLSELQAQAQEHMAAPAHLPLVKLTGVTPAGLNASSEGEIQVMYDYIHSEQEDIGGPILDIMLDAIQCSEFGELDEDIDYEFVPLVEQTPKEKSEIRKSDADLATALIDRGVISAEEERDRLMHDPDSGYSNLTGDPPDLPPDQAFQADQSDADREHGAAEADKDRAQATPAEKND